MHNEKPTDIAFLFDLDGVIIDSEGPYSRIWDSIEEIYPTGNENFANEIKGSTLDNILTKWFRKEDRPDVERRLYEMEAKMIYETCTGAVEFLNLLKDKGIPAALVTSSDKLKMDHLWQQMPWLKDFFKVIIIGDMVSRSKPDPDSRQGLEAARASGAKVVGVAGTLPREEVEKLADITVGNLMELEPLLTHADE